jgi:hypothetical protein
MSNFAVINGNIVENIIVADTKEIAEEATGKTCVECSEENPAVIGLSWSQESGFEQPPAPEAPESGNIIGIEE